MLLDTLYLTTWTGFSLFFKPQKAGKLDRLSSLAVETSASLLLPTNSSSTLLPQRSIISSPSDRCWQFETGVQATNTETGEREFMALWHGRKVCQVVLSYNGAFRSIILCIQSHIWFKTVCVMHVAHMDVCLVGYHLSFQHWGLWLSSIFPHSQP